MSGNYWSTRPTSIGSLQAPPPPLPAPVNCRTTSWNSSTCLYLPTYFNDRSSLSENRTSAGTVSSPAAAIKLLLQPFNGHLSRTTRVTGTRRMNHLLCELYEDCACTSSDTYLPSSLSSLLRFAYISIFTCVDILCCCYHSYPS